MDAAGEAPDSYWGALADTWTWIVAARAIVEFAHAVVAGCQESPHITPLAAAAASFDQQVPALGEHWRNPFLHIARVGSSKHRTEQQLQPGVASVIDDVIDDGATVVSAIEVDVERHHPLLVDLHRAIRAFLAHYGGPDPSIMVYGGFQGH